MASMAAGQFLVTEPPTEDSSWRALVREATLGCQVEVPTLDGRATLTIPAGTDSGSRLRMRGKGVGDPRGGDQGDLIVRIQIRVPRDLDEEARASLEELSRYEDPEIRKELFS